MSNGKVTLVRGGPTTQTLVYGMVTLIRGQCGGNFGAVTGVRGRSAPSWGGRVTSVRGRSVGSVTYPVSAGTAATFEPFAVAALTGSPDGVEVASWAWAQETGPAVTLVGTGPTKQFITPGTRAGTTCRFRVTATFTDTTTTTATVTHTIRGHGGPWTYNSGSIVAVAINPPVL